MDQLFETDSLVDRTREGKQCKTCEFYDRYYYEGRWIYAACAIKGTKQRNHRVKAHQQACAKYQERK